MKYTNLIHNILNIAIALIGGLEVIDLSPFFNDPMMSVKIVAGLAITKLVMNVARDGLTGLVKEQPPVK